MTKYNLRFNGIRIKYNGIANIVVNSEIPLNQATPDNPGENPNPGGNTETEFVDKMSSQSFTVSYNNSTKQVTFGGAAMTYQTFKNVEYYIGSGTHHTTTASSVSLSTLQSQYNMSGGTSGTTYTLYAQVISTEGNKTALKSTSITIAADVDPISTFTPTLYNDGDTILWDFYESDEYSTTAPTVYYKVNNLTEYSMNQEDVLTVAMLKSKYNLAEDSDYTLSIRFGRGSTYSNSKTITFHIDAITISYKRVEQTSTYSSLSTSDFNDAETIYKKVDVANGDRLMIITRHTIRNSNSGKQSGALFATDSSQYINGYDGVTLIANNIYKLQGAPFNDPSTDAYFSTNVKRCVETSYLIGKLRGNSALTRMGTISNLEPLPGTSNASSNATADQNWEAETAVIHNGAVSPYGDSSQYSNIEAIKAVPGPHCYFNDRIWSTNASWPEVQNYYKNNKDNCIKKCTEAINWLAEASHGHPFTYMTGHDLSVLPFVCFATNNGNMFSSWNNTDYSSNPTGWIYYCAGVAVIVHANGNWEIYPVRLSERGKFT